nr:hypothetical protein [Tanacetum cinerariifolium]
MDMTIDQQVALDEALVPHASRLRLEKAIFILDQTSHVPEIYMQEFWATAIIHHHSIHFKMNNKKRIVNLEYFREMLHICPRIPKKIFDELSFEEEIIAFLIYLGHSGEIKKITDVNINKLHQPWGSFAAVINKFLSGKSTGYDSLRDDQMFTPIKLVSRHQNTQQFGAMFPVELKNEDIRNSAAYKEYHAITSGAAPPKTKASTRKTQSSFDTTMPPLMTAGTRLSTSAKRKQPAKSSKAKGLSVLSEVALTEAEQIKLAIKRSLQQIHISQASRSNADKGTDNDGDDFVHPKLSTHDEEAKDEESFDPIVQTPSHVENSNDESNDDESHGMNVGGDEGPDVEDDDEELYRDVNINLEGRDIQMTDVHTTQVLKYTHVTLTPVNPDGQQQSSSLSSQFVTSMFNPSPDAGIDSLFESTHRVGLDYSCASSSDCTNSSSTIHSSHTVNEQLEAEVLTRASNSSKTSYDVVADLSELELKKILIEKMESNKSIHRFDEQRNLYKALVDA